jgi:nitrate/nitrite transporter NarK
LSGQFGVPQNQLILYVLIVAYIIFRVSRPQRISVVRLWITVGAAMVLPAVVVYPSVVFLHVAVWEIAIAALVGLVFGVPIGLLRGHHTPVSTTETHGVMRLGASWTTALIYLLAFGGRFAIRLVLPPTSPLGNVVSDGLIFFAIGIIGATYYAVYRKYEQLDHAIPASR